MRCVALLARSGATASLSVGGTEELLAPAHMRSLAAFVFEEVAVSDRRQLQAAGRLDHIAVDGTGALFPATFLPPGAPTEFGVSRTYQPTSASAGLLYGLTSDIVARVTAQHVERAPDPIELFYKGRTTRRARSRSVIRICGEKANTLGLKKTHGVSASMLPPITRFTDFIFKNFTGARCNDTFATCGMPGASFDQIIYSQRDARFIGAEAQVEYDFGAWRGGVWGVEAQYDFVDARFNDGSFVPKIPPHRIGGGLYYRAADWNGRVHLLHAFAQNRLGAFETPTAGYTLLNAEISPTRRFAESGPVPEVTIGLRGENLLNQNVRLHQSYKKTRCSSPV